MGRRRRLRQRVRIALAVFTAGLVLSGLTAIPLEWELEALARWLGAGPNDGPADHTGLAAWIVRVRDGLRETYARYPFVAYGTDWLAFAHVVLAILFAGALRDPVRNRWIITFGLVACALVVPWSLGFGALRGIPVGWRLVDCTFGVGGAIPLGLAWRDIRRLADLRETGDP